MPFCLDFTVLLYLPAAVFAVFLRLPASGFCLFYRSVDTIYRFLDYCACAAVSGFRGFLPPLVLRFTCLPFWFMPFTCYRSAWFRRHHDFGFWIYLPFLPAFVSRKL